MTRKQAEELSIIISKLEALQHELSPEESDIINDAKSRLIPLWSRSVRDLDASK